MRIKQVIASVLGFTMMIGCIPALAAEESADVYIDYQFDSELTNVQPEYVQINSGSARVVETGNENKALLMDEKCNKLYIPTGSLQTELVISMSLKKTTQKLSANVGFTANVNATVSKLFTIADGEMKTTDGRVFGSVNDREFTKVTFVVNKKNLIDIYVNGDRKIKQWKNSAAIDTGFMIEKTNGGLLVDDFAIYKGNDILKQFPKTPFVNDGDAYVEYNYLTNADFAFVDTENLCDYEWASKGSYKNTSVSNKGNTIVLNRLAERLNPDRKDGHIIMEKTLETDAHIDFNSLNDVNRAGYCPYYLYQGNLKVEKFGSPIKFAYFRDNTSGGNVDVNAAYIDVRGNVITGSGKAVKKLKKDEWMNYWIVFDLANHRCDVYIEGELADSFSYNANFKLPVMLRIWIDVGGGNTRVIYDKLKVIGMRNAFDPENPDAHPSFFSGDEGIEEFMKDKIAFYAYSENVFANGEKHIRVAKPMKDDNETEVYVPAKSLSLGYGFDLKVDPASKTASDDKVKLTADSVKVTYDGQEYTMLHACKWANDTLYIPVDTFSEDVLGYCVKNDGNGLVVTAKEKFYLDETEDTPDYLLQQATRWGDYKTNPPSPMKVINWYMSFERPTQETILTDFNKTTDNGAKHPRAVATKEDFDRVRSNKDTDETMKSMVEKLIAQADTYLDVVPGEYEIPDKQRILDKARAYLNYLLPLGFAYQVTGEQKYAAKVWEMFQTVLEFPDWNPSHMIDTGELVGAVGAAYDWCYDYFTPEQRQYIYERVKKLGIAPIADAQKDIITTRYEWAGANDFVYSKSNFNTVINGGVMTAATAFMEMDPEYLSSVLKESMRSMEFSTFIWRPAGIWMESPSYWTYASQYFTKGVGSLLNATGQHYGLLDAQGIDRTGMWIRSMASYGGLNNFHDAGAGKLATPYTGWFAKVYDQPALSAATVNQVISGDRAPSPEDPLWYIPNNTATEDDLPLDYWADGFDTVASRGSYTDKYALFYSTHGGQVTCYHSQYDVCTFVLDLMGTRWIDDLGSDDYNVRRDQNGFDKMYRDIAEGHSVMVFNNGVPGQHKDGCAEMTRWESKDLGSIATYDLSTVYLDDVTSASRGFYVGDTRRSLTVRDEFTAKKNMPAHWYAQTGASVEIVDNHTAVLSRGGQKLKMEVLSNVDNYILTVGDARPSETSPDIPGQNKNVGYSRIDIQMELKANTPYYVTVKFSPYNEPTEPIENINMPMDQWQLPDGTYTPREALNVKIYANGRPAEEIMTNGRIGVVEGEPYPEITAVPEKESTIVEVLPKQEDQNYITVRAYSADRSYFVDYNVEFKVSKADDTSKLTEHPIKSVNVSSTQETENAKENMLDNNYSTRWTSNNAAGEWVILDMGEEVQIDKIGLAFWRGDIRSYLYTIYLSNDGENWTQVADGGSSGDTEGLELVDIGGSGRYIKYVSNGNTQNYNCNILEFKVYQNQ